jgi:hypothetical protein
LKSYNSSLSLARGKQVQKFKVQSYKRRGKQQRKSVCNSVLIDEVTPSFLLPLLDVRLPPKVAGVLGFSASPSSDSLLDSSFICSSPSSSSSFLMPCQPNLHETATH